MTPFDAFLTSRSISTDTRSIAPGSVFFALKGANFNGNAFAKQALDGGAAYAVVDEELDIEDDRLIQVEDVLTALQDTARMWRRHLGLPIIGLTGSNGKTTNKELFQSVLSKKYKVHATAGNFNNHIGVPLTLLAMTEAHEMAVVEMGANHQKEIAFLARIAEPNLGYITNYGKAHLEGFGGVEGIIKGKSELYDYVAAFDQEALVNADDAKQMEKSGACRNRSFFGQREGEVLWESHSHSEFAGIRFKAHGSWWNVQSHLSGSFNEANLAAAAALGIKYGVEAKDIVEALESYVPNMNRVEWRDTGKNKVLLDAYNANPTSMSLSIDSFAKWHKDGIMVLGDMFELGEASAAEHEAIVQLVLDLGLEKQCILVGKLFQATTWKGTAFRTTAELLENWQQKGAPKGAHILLKGSRGIALEKLLPLL